MSLKAGCPYTVSVMFKDPPKDLVPHAWNILRHICRGKELFPEKVEEWMQDVLKNYAGQEQKYVQRGENDDEMGGNHGEKRWAPGYASATPSRKRRGVKETCKDEAWGEENLGDCLGEVIESPTNMFNRSPTGDPEIDWGGENEFVSTKELDEELQNEVTSKAQKEMAEEAEVGEIRSGMKHVGFLRSGPEIVRSDTDDRTAIGIMQAFKNREQESVRWRSVTEHVNDVDLMTQLADMRVHAEENTEFEDLRVLLPSSASKQTVHQFIERAHSRNLNVINLKLKQNHKARKKFQKLLEELPASTVKKVPPGQLNTSQGRARAITQLISKHSGEVVELDPCTTEWRLMKVGGFSYATKPHWDEEQIWCMPDGFTRSWSQYECPSDYDCGCNRNQDALLHQLDQCRHFTNRHLSVDMLMPNWQEQWNRLQVPCKQARGYMWFRTGKITTLGELFLALGRAYTAACIYAFYRTCRVVVTKRRQTKSHRPGSASKWTGLTGGPLQASNMKRSLCSNTTTQKCLVAEYCEATGCGEQPITKQLLDAAVRHMHKILLCDLNPPWMDHQFPQALTGKGVLSRFTRPSFLQWTNDSEGKIRALFGKELSDRVERQMEYMGLVHAGFVARPLYACTKLIEGGEMCMKVASMSKYIQQRDGRSHYRCMDCRKKEGTDATPISDSVPLRVLDLYISVRDGSKTTIMRSKPYRLCLWAPPNHWAWGVDCGQPSLLNQAKPMSFIQSNGKFYQYNKMESDAIWCGSSSYEGKPQ